MRLWDVESRVQLGPTLSGHSQPVRAVAFSPDGGLIASGGDDSTVVLSPGAVWSDARALRRQICALATVRLGPQEWAQYAAGSGTAPAADEPDRGDRAATLRRDLGARGRRRLRGRRRATAPPATAAAAAQAGGKLTMVWIGDPAQIDCGRSDEPMVWMICCAPERPLYNYRPGSAGMVPDLAEGAPAISDGGRTVTVRIRPGVRFSPPVSREVTSRDVKYAVERAFFKTVGNGYVSAYFGALKGARTEARPGSGSEAWRPLTT